MEDLSSPTTIDQPPVSKVHTWILVLLSWTAVLSLIAVGLLLTKSSPNLSTSDITIACQNGALNGITTNLTRISDACQATNQSEDPKTKGPKKLIFSGTEFYPGFILPGDWQVSGDWTKDGDQSSYTMQMSNKPLIITLFGSDAPSATKIWTTTTHAVIIAADAQAQYVAAQFADAKFAGTTTTSTPITGGILYTTKTTVTSDLRGAEKETVLNFFGTTSSTVIRYIHGSVDSVWDEFAASLNWSTV